MLYCLYISCEINNKEVAEQTLSRQMGGGKHSHSWTAAKFIKLDSKVCKVTVSNVALSVHDLLYLQTSTGSCVWLFSVLKKKSWNKRRRNLYCVTTWTVYNNLKPTIIYSLVTRSSKTSCKNQWHTVPSVFHQTGVDVISLQSWNIEAWLCFRVVRQFVPVTVNAISPECLEGPSSKYGANIHLDSRMSWLDFGGQRSNVTVTSQGNCSYLVQVISLEQHQGILSHWHNDQSRIKSLY